MHPLVTTWGSKLSILRKGYNGVKEMSSSTRKIRSLSANAVPLGRSLTALRRRRRIPRIQVNQNFQLGYGLSSISTPADSIVNGLTDTEQDRLNCSY
jgi:hypothetical protein